MVNSTSAVAKQSQLEDEPKDKVQQQRVGENNMEHSHETATSVSNFQTGQGSHSNKGKQKYSWMACVLVIECIMLVVSVAVTGYYANQNRQIALEIETAKNATNCTMHCQTCSTNESGVTNTSSTPTAEPVNITIFTEA